MRQSEIVICAIALNFFAVASASSADKKYDPGASDTEIKIGQTMPYSGPASGYGTQGKAELAYAANDGRQLQPTEDGRANP
jgi:ABC-type branched-subunit amino acid transport system substrate-binding protein